MIARSALLPVLTMMSLTAGTALAQETSPATTAAPVVPAEAPPATEVPSAAQAPSAAQTPAPAAGQPDLSAAYENARNQLGVLTYCQDKGYIDNRAVEMQVKLLGMIPAGDVVAGDAAEAKGKAGTVSAMGIERSLSDAAIAQSKTEDALCDEMDSLLHELAARIPS